mgnify:CR=1 FL=1
MFLQTRNKMSFGEFRQRLTITHGIRRICVHHCDNSSLMLAVAQICLDYFDGVHCGGVSVHLTNIERSTLLYAAANDFRRARIESSALLHRSPYYAAVATLRL